MNTFKKYIITVLSTILITSFITFTITAQFYNYKGSNSLSYNKLDELAKEINTSYVGEYTNDALIDGAAHGLVNGIGDKYSAYLNEREYEDAITEYNGSYIGIGAVLYPDEKDGLMTIFLTYDDSPSKRAGLLVGDKLLKVDDIEINSENFEYAVDYMKGQTDENPDTDTMKFTVMRDQDKFDVDITREPIKIKSVNVSRVDDIAYIVIAVFEEATYDQFKAALDSVSDVKGIIIDLRFNPGGSVNSVLKIADEIIPKGLIFYTEEKSGHIEKAFANDKFNNKPLILLVNGSSASASEILAGAVKDRGRGKLVGEKTYGKGVVQSLLPLKGGKTALKLTTAKYYTPSGICIDKIGIAPDVEVKPSEDIVYGDIKTDNVLQKAVEILNEK